MTNLSIALALAFALQQPAASPPAAAPSGGPASAVTPASGDGALDPNKMICRHVRGTGSRLTEGKVCMPRWQWAERTADDKKALVDMQNGIRCARGTC